MGKKTLLFKQKCLEKLFIVKCSDLLVQLIKKAFKIIVLKSASFPCQSNFLKKKKYKKNYESYSFTMAIK